MVTDRVILSESENRQYLYTETDPKLSRLIPITRGCFEEIVYILRLSSDCQMFLSAPSLRSRFCPSALRPLFTNFAVCIFFFRQTTCICICRATIHLFIPSSMHILWIGTFSCICYIYNSYSVRPRFWWKWPCVGIWPVNHCPMRVKPSRWLTTKTSSNSATPTKTKTRPSFWTCA